jgi:hypothetical protein
MLQRAVERARADVHTPPEADAYQNVETRLLIRVCFQLQRIHGDKAFFLSYRVAGEILSLSHTEAGKRLEILMKDGILAIAAAHTRRLATSYRYIGKHGVSQ